MSSIGHAIYIIVNEVGYDVCRQGVHISRGMNIGHAKHRPYYILAISYRDMLDMYAMVCIGCEIYRKE